MNEHPILFSTPMVQAILEGRKTQTRRVVKGNPEGKVPFTDEFPCPYGHPGDRLWVRETWQKIYERQSDKQRFTEPPSAHNLHLYKTWIEYAATPRDEQDPPRWRPSIFMPRSASRITLEIVNVRLERVQQISMKDCLKEGVGELLEHGKYFKLGSYLVGTFAHLWDSINSKRGYGWDTNPWVWVVEFKPLMETETK